MRLLRFAMPMTAACLLSASPVLAADPTPSTPSTKPGADKNYNKDKRPSDTTRDPAMDKDKDMDMDKGTGDGMPKGDAKAMGKKPTTASDTGSPGTTTTLTDNELLNRIHAINLMEIDMGRMAESKGENKKVKSYGKDLQKDHGKAEKTLADLAKKRNFVLAPPALNSETDKQQQKDDAAAMDNLKTLNGAAFDREFVSAMQKGHEKAIALVTDAQSRMTDKDTKKMLDKLLPQLRDHLKKANELMDKTLKAAS